MKYVNQLDHPEILYPTNTDLPDEQRGERWKYTTFASSACGLACAIMVADRLRVDPGFGIPEALALSYDCGGNHSVGTDYKVFAPAFAAKFNLRYEGTNDPERLRHCLRTGGAAVLNSGGDRDGYVGVFTHGGHYITAIAELEDGRICILDPSQKDGKYAEPGRVGKVEVDGHLLYTDMQVLVDDCSNRDPGFHLFWRK